MTVDQLINELQTMPRHAEVRVLTRVVYVPGNEAVLTLWHSGGRFDVPPEQAGPADDVRYMGQYVLIEGK